MSHKIRQDVVVAKLTVLKIEEDSVQIRIEEYTSQGDSETTHIRKMRLTVGTEITVSFPVILTVSD